LAKNTRYRMHDRYVFPAVGANTDSLHDMILTHYYRQWRAERGLPETHEAASDHPPKEDAGQSPAS